MTGENNFPRAHIKIKFYDMKPQSSLICTEKGFLFFKKIFSFPVCFRRTGGFLTQWKWNEGVVGGGNFGRLVCGHNLWHALWSFGKSRCLFRLLFLCQVREDRFPGGGREKGIITVHSFFLYLCLRERKSPKKWIIINKSLKHSEGKNQFPLYSIEK